METLERTYIQRALDEQYARHNETIHVSHIPVNIMKYCLRNYAKVFSIMGNGRYVLVENIINKKQALVYLMMDNSIAHMTLWMHRDPVWENTLWK